MNPVIYVVEDDPNIAHVIQIALSNSNFEVSIYPHAMELYKAIDQTKPKLVIVDLMLPDIDGIEIIQTIKKRPGFQSVPILIVSAKTAELDKVIGLDVGADDYMVKPFGVLELISRVKALLRRYELLQSNDVIVFEGIKLDPLAHECQVQDHVVLLTAKEFALLKTLMQANGQTLSRDYLLNVVWGYDFIGETRTLDVHIKELRQKLGKAGGKLEWIQTIRGVGYKFVG